MNYISRAEAQKRGLKRFFEGMRCRRGHVTPRFTSNGDCCGCANERAAEARKLPKVGTAHQRYLKNRLTFMLSGAKKRAQRDGLPFDIALADLVMPEFCPVLGLKLVSSQGRPSDASPSLDKIRPELGYVRGNIAIISNRANRLKMNATAEELRAVARWMDAIALV